MVKERMDLLELLHKGGMDGDVDFLREALRVLVEGIMDAEVSSRIGAEYGERSPERVTQRNGYRSRAWDTRVGTMELHIPKLREGSYFPSLLEPRRRSERALLAVIQQAYVEGVSTRRVDDLVKALGCEGISKSQVSRICQELDVVVDGFLGRPLDGGPYPYLWLDALTQKVREDGRIVNVSVVVATAVNGEGKREFIGMDVGTSEDGAFWLAFLRSLSARGLSGVELVVSDAHQGLRGAIAAVFGGASWQRRRTHFMTNLLTRVPRRAQPWVATMVRTIYQQPSPDEVHAQLDRVTSQLHDRFPEVASLLDEAGPDVLAFSSLAHSPTGRSSGPTTHRSVSTRRSGDAPMWWASSLTGRPCAASLAPSWLSSTTNGSSDVDTSHPPFSPSTKLFRRPISRRRQPPKQQQHDDALLHHLTGRDPVCAGTLPPRIRRTARVVAILLLSVALIVVIATPVFADLEKRFGQTFSEEEFGSARIDQYRADLDQFLYHPMFGAGSGAGSHHSYVLTLSAKWGMMVAVPLLWLWARIFADRFVLWRIARSPNLKAIAAASMASVIPVMVDSLLDANLLQLVGNPYPMIFWTTTGIAAVSLRLAKSERVSDLNAAKIRLSDTRPAFRKG